MPSASQRWRSVEATALWNVKRMPPSLLGAAELSLLNMLNMQHVFHKIYRCAEVITARVKVVVEPLSFPQFPEPSSPSDYLWDRKRSENESSTASMTCIMASGQRS
jgi:hypothetical protein